jgi:hypothetical protein
MCFEALDVGIWEKENSCSFAFGYAANCEDDGADLHNYELAGAFESNSLIRTGYEDDLARQVYSSWYRRRTW